MTRATLQVLAGTLLIGLAATAVTTSAAAADETATYPARPVRVVVGVPPGSGADTVTRAVALKLAEAWGRGVVVDNRPGAGGVIAMDLVRKADPDGYTLLSASVSLVATAKPLKKVTYDAMDAFEPIVQITSQPYIVVAYPGAPFNSIRELLALARAKPGSLNYASSGAGSASHLGTELFKSMAKVDLVHVPYKGLAQAMTDVASGQVQVLFSTVVSALPFVKSRRVKVIAVTTRTRLKSMPDVPTVSESGLPGFELSSAYSLYAPAHTPAAVVTKVNRDVLALLGTPEVSATLAADGAEVAEPNTPREFRKAFLLEAKRWAALIRTLSIVKN